MGVDELKASQDLATLREQGVWAEGHAVLTCGPTTGHFVKPVCFCVDDRAAAAVALAIQSITHDNR